MVTHTLPVTSTTADHLNTLGQQIRAQRKALYLSATAVAEAAGMSRVTLHRIEKGEPAVTMGAYFNVMRALGMNFGLHQPPALANTQPGLAHEGWIPARIRLADYPQLKQLAWHVQGLDSLTPTEALGIYERNWRHVDEALLVAHEQQLIAALRLGFGAGAITKIQANPV